MDNNTYIFEDLWGAPVMVHSYGENDVYITVGDSTLSTETSLQFDTKTALKIARKLIKLCETSKGNQDD